MKSDIRLIDERTLNELATAAKGSPRRRKNLNLHAGYDEPCQRLLNAVEPDSYTRPHRHLNPPKPECFLAVRGKMVVLIFGDDGSIERIVPMAPGSGTIAIDIPAGVWHAVVSLQSGAVFFETKPGPYEPLADKDFAPWAPPEGADEASSYLADLRRAIDASMGEGS